MSEVDREEGLAAIRSAYHRALRIFATQSERDLAKERLSQMSQESQDMGQRSKLLGDEEDRFEERAATLEFEAGLSRPRAEFQAMVEILSRPRRSKP